MGHAKAQRDRVRFHQLVADANDLLEHEIAAGTAKPDVKPVNHTEIRGWGLGILLAWSKDLARRRVAAGLPENVDLKEHDGIQH